MNPLVSVVIVTHDRSRLLENCLKGVQGQTYPHIEVIVVDNGSHDETYSILATVFNRVIVIKSQENELYARAANKGMRQARGEIIVCLNNDVSLDREFITEAVSAFFLDPRIGMVQGKILAADGRRIDSTGLFLSRSGSARERGHRRPDTTLYEAPGFVFGVCGAVGCYRRSMLVDIEEDGSCFDEAYEFFYEDLDLCIRAQTRGWKAYYTPRAVAFHKRGGTCQAAPPLGRGEGRRRYAFMGLPNHLKIMYLSNRYYMLRKHCTRWHIVQNLPWLLMLELRWWLYLLFFEPHLIGPVITRVRLLITGLKEKGCKT
ncbi:MAG: glycosyltransferase family 2 protein [Candidatus Omnitrophica bacterium]|nr:glycosyltransferase family 2 protein [Candidatus Omnitrophota bacterium]